MPCLCFWFTAAGCAGQELITPPAATDVFTTGTDVARPGPQRANIAELNLGLCLQIDCVCEWVCHCFALLVGCWWLGRYVMCVWGAWSCLIRYCLLGSCWSRVVRGACVCEYLVADCWTALLGAYSYKACACSAWLVACMVRLWLFIIRFVGGVP